MDDVGDCYEEILLNVDLQLHGLILMESNIMADISDPIGLFLFFKLHCNHWLAGRLCIVFLQYSKSMLGEVLPYYNL